MLTILWDNDGVLVDTEGLYFQACREVLGSVGVDLTLDQFQEISLRRGESVLVLAAGRGVGQDGIARLRVQRDRCYAQLLGARSCVVDGAEDVLRCLHGQVRMGVVTSARQVHFDITHAKTGLRQYLDFVLTREDYRLTKPHPEPYLTALARYDLSPEHCLVIEDSERGLAAAAAAGLACLLVRSHWTRDGDFRQAVKVLDGIREVPGEIRNFGYTTRG